MKMMRNKNSLYKMFNILNKENRSSSSIIEELKIKMPAFYKNIKKLKNAGFEINKENNLYSLEKYKQILNITNQEKSAIAYMLYSAFKFLPDYKYKKFQSFIKKNLLLANSSDKKEVDKKFNLIKKYNLIEEYSEKINKLKFYIIQKQTVKITLRSSRTVTAKPIEINWQKDKPIFRYVNINKDKLEELNIEQIVKIENSETTNYISQKEEIIFELYGILAKRYLLKDGERIIKNKKDSIVIASDAKNKEMLFQRLFRYDTLCKILFPKKEVQEFNKLIDKAIINIGT
jgi:biotin operon repressor